MRAALDLKGRLQPAQYVELAAPLPGRIESAPVGEGEAVQAGQVLAVLEGGEAAAARLAAAELDSVLARQALDELERQAQVELAQLEGEIAAVERQRAFAADRLRRLEEPEPPLHIAQAHANWLLAADRLERAQDDLRKAEQRFANKKSILRLFFNQRAIRLTLTQLRADVAFYQRRLDDAHQKYEDLTAPVDAIDLENARRELALLDARLARLRDDLAGRLGGPDPNALEAANARRRAAAAALEAARLELERLTLRAPFSGVIVRLDWQPGGYVQPGAAGIVLADLSAWVVEVDDLPEAGAAALQAGQLLRLSFDAYPDLALEGLVGAVSLYAREDDGEVYYTLRLEVQGSDPRLRWGLTARVR